MTVASNLKNTATGMTDTELELACKTKTMVTSPWAHWTSELYSFGKCLRFWTKYPNFLPLYVYSDHGAGLHSHLFPHELKNQAAVHLTWHPMKEQRHKGLVGKQMLRIIHPWISYRRLMGIKRSPQPQGTLAFLTHHAPGIKWECHDTEEYFSTLRKLPREFQPVVLCVHMHDVNAGHHKELRHHGFPIVTLGNTSSFDFVDRFYDLVKDFSYGTSIVWGSQLAYCVEFGMPYFLLGKHPRLINISHKEMPLGDVVYQDEFEVEYEKQAKALFKFPVSSVSHEQRIFVESLLGCDSNITPKQMARIFWREFFRNWRQCPLILRTLLVEFLRKIGTLEMIKMLLRE